MFAIASLLVAVLLAGSNQVADPASNWNGLPTDYRSLVEQYQKSPSLQTASRLLPALDGQPFGKIESIQKRSNARPSSVEDLAYFRVAAMLHTDAAEILLGTGRVDRAPAHLRIARQWADLCERPSETPRSFRRRWQVVAAMMVIQQGLAAGSVERARIYVNDACDQLRDDVPLLTIGAWLNEQAALAPLPTAQGAERNQRGIIEKQQLLDVADDLLERALQVEPSAVEASLRRARVLTLRDKHVEARKILAQLSERVGLSPNDAYLAKILLARIEEQTSNDAKAVALYEEAVAILPLAPPARMGLARLRSVSGDSLASQQIIAPLIASEANVADPWFDYLTLHLRSADAARDAMRAEVRR